MKVAASSDKMFKHFKYPSVNYHPFFPLLSNVTFHLDKPIIEKTKTKKQTYVLPLPSVVVAPGAGAFVVGVVVPRASVVVPAVGIGAVVGVEGVVPELGAIVVPAVGTGSVVGLRVVAAELGVVVPARRCETICNWEGKKHSSNEDSTTLIGYFFL